MSKSGVRRREPETIVALGLRFNRLAFTSIPTVGN